MKPNKCFVVEPLEETLGTESKPREENPVVQLQLAMAVSSINHEYARIEYDDTLDQDRQEELLDYMNACREKYFEARENLKHFDTMALAEFEADLLRQKEETLSSFDA